MTKNKDAAKTETTTATMAPLPKLPRLPRVRKPKPPKPCACGCGNQTKGGRFLPGHDGRLHGWVIRVERGVVKLADIPDGERQATEAAIKAKAAKAKAA